MASPTVGTTHRDPDNTPHEDGRLVSERSGSGEATGLAGVSDRRRAELERLEAEAGTVQDSAQQAQRPAPKQPGNSTSGMLPDPDSAQGQVGTGNNTDPNLANPDIDKQ